MMTHTQNTLFKLQVAAIILMTAGWGWSGGNFTPSGAPLWNYLAHCVSIILLLAFSLGFFHVPDTRQPTKSNSNWATVSISIFAVLSIIGCIVLIVLGASNSDPNAVGVKTFADWFPTIILNMGTFLWLATLLPARQRSARARTVSINQESSN